MIAIYMTRCPSCGVYARYIIDRGPFWAVIFCPCCDPVLVSGREPGALPERYAHLWPSRARSPWQERCIQERLARERYP
jgi:hypothetical protein